jgi:hypothetical protein
MKMDRNESMKTGKTLTWDIHTHQHHPGKVGEACLLSNVEYSIEWLVMELAALELSSTRDCGRSLVMAPPRRHLSTLISIGRQIMRLTGGDLRDNFPQTPCKED